MYRIYSSSTVLCFIKQVLCKRELAANNVQNTKFIEFGIKCMSLSNYKILHACIGKGQRIKAKMLEEVRLLEL